jgi:hypothetical protein
MIENKEKFWVFDNNKLLLLEGYTKTESVDDWCAGSNRFYVADQVFLTFDSSKKNLIEKEIENVNGFLELYQYQEVNHEQIFTKKELSDALEKKKILLDLKKDL